MRNAFLMLAASVSIGGSVLAQNPSESPHVIIVAPSEEEYIQFDQPQKEPIRIHLVKASNFTPHDLDLIAPYQTTKIEVRIPRLRIVRIVDVVPGERSYFYFSLGHGDLSVAQQESPS